jgi:hypothetical protein
MVTAVAASHDVVALTQIKNTAAGPLRPGVWLNVLAAVAIDACRSILIVLLQDFGKPNVNISVISLFKVLQIQLFAIVCSPVAWKPTIVAKKFSNNKISWQTLVTALQLCPELALDTSAVFEHDGIFHVNKSYATLLVII